MPPSLFNKRSSTNCVHLKSFIHEKENLHRFSERSKKGKVRTDPIAIINRKKSRKRVSIKDLLSGVRNM